MFVNHKAPSGPAVIPSGLADARSGVVGDGPSRRDAPDGGVRSFVNHKAPSGPAVIPAGLLMPVPV